MNSKQQKLSLESTFRRYWKDKEKELLNANVSKENIELIKKFDRDWIVNQESARLHNNDYVTNPIFFNSIAYNTRPEINSFDDLLNQVSNEAYYSYLSKADPVLQDILYLRFYEEYSIDEISKKIGISSNAIYKRIKKFQRNYKA